jgi:S-adenosyl methyltransferase
MPCVRRVRLYCCGERRLMGSPSGSGRVPGEQSVGAATRAARGCAPVTQPGTAVATYMAGQPGGQDFDPRVPNVARIYDFLLGGKDNFEADRQAARQLVEAVPGAALAAWDNRAFLGRAVRFLAREAGIRQFLDIGTGLPTRGNVHEIVQEIDPLTRVVYCDNDPMVVVHANALLASESTVSAVYSDLRYPHHLLAMPAVWSLMDLDKPLAVLMVAVLQFIEDREDPWDLVHQFKSAMSPGSYLVLSHVTGDDLADDAQRRAYEVYEKASAPGVARSRAEIDRFFDGLDMVAPGLVSVCDWRPVLERRRQQPTLFYAGVGRKPGHIPGVLA